MVRLFDSRLPNSVPKPPLNKHESLWRERLHPNNGYGSSVSARESGPSYVKLRLADVPVILNYKNCGANRLSNSQPPKPYSSLCHSQVVSS
jgi:hypothetical protein